MARWKVCNEAGCPELTTTAKCAPCHKRYDLDHMGSAPAMRA